MKLLTNYLRAFLLLLSFLLVLIFIYLFPDFLTVGSYAHISIFMRIYFGTGLYLSGILSAIIIIYSWKLLHLADKQNIFSHKGVQTLRMIKWLFYSIALTYIVISPAFAAMDSNDCSPIGVLLEAFLIMLGLMLGAFVNVLQLVVQRVINSKKETELSI